MKLIIATDHRGVSYKKELINRLKEEYEIIDASPENYDTDDYPDFAFRVAKLTLETENAYGILVCATGIGMCIAANKVKGARCALVHDLHAAEYARLDDDANIIALDSAMDVELSTECIKTFINTPFKEEEKYHRRVNKIIKYENGEYNGI